MNFDINDPEWRKKILSLSTSEVSDALDFFGLPGSALGIHSVAGPARIFGKAFTIRFGPLDRMAPGTVGDYIDELQPGTVAVLDNRGRCDCTVWGGIVSRLGAQKKLAGAVINGVCRDNSEADEVQFPVYSKGRFMRTGKDRVQVEAYQEPVMVGDVRVCPDDFIFGDADGLVVVPAKKAEQVFDKALQMHQVEENIITAALGGLPLTEARKKFGYHVLQRTPNSLPDSKNKVEAPQA